MPSILSLRRRITRTKKLLSENTVLKLRNFLILHGQDFYLDWAAKNKELINEISDTTWHKKRIKMLSEVYMEDSIDWLLSVLAILQEYQSRIHLHLHFDNGQDFALKHAVRAKTLKSSLGYVEQATINAEHKYGLSHTLWFWSDIYPAPFAN